MTETMTPEQQDKRGLAITRTLNDLDRIINRVGKHLTSDEIRARRGLDQFRHDLIQLRADLLHTADH